MIKRTGRFFKKNKSLKTERLVSSINKSVDKLSSRTEIVQGKVSEVEIALKKLPQNALRKITKIVKYKKRDIEERIRNFSMYISESLEGNNKDNGEAHFKKIINESIPKLKKKNMRIPFKEAQLRLS